MTRRASLRRRATRPTAPLRILPFVAGTAIIASAGWTIVESIL
jgi:hypothetical protein